MNHKHAKRPETRSNGRNSLVKVLWALCALLIGVAGTAAFFLIGPANSPADVGTARQNPSDTAIEATAENEPDRLASSDGANEAVTDDTARVDARTMLASWNPKSDAYAQLTSFVENACDESGGNYIPPEERVATFDMDGTFLCEKAPIYIDQVFACWHVLEDPTFEAPADLRFAVESVYGEVQAGLVPKSVNLNTILALCYEGHTPDELMDDVLRFAKDTEAAGFSSMTYSQSFYAPMLEAIDYLRANDFDVYVVTACERYVSRALAVEYAGFDPAHVVGTDLITEASGQGNTDSLDYTFEQDDELVIAGARAEETGRTNKVIAIQNEIGRRPVIAFGNSSGDFAMLNYAAANPDRHGLGFLVIADDTEREYGDEDEAASMRGEAAQEGWIGISMRDDWTTIYGAGVQKTALPAQGEMAKAA